VTTKCWPVRNRFQQLAARVGDSPRVPQLYLFLGEALTQYLQAQGFGVMVGRRLTCCQFADDVQVFLESRQQKPALLASLQVFCGASGQADSLPMTKSTGHWQGAALSAVG
jgi:hypothetical protein